MKWHKGNGEKEAEKKTKKPASTRNKTPEKSKKTAKAPTKTTVKKSAKPTPTKKKAKADKKPEKKPAKKVVKKAVPAEPENAIESVKIQKNTEISPEIETEIDCGIIDFCDVELLPRMRDFLAYYLTPGQQYYHNALKAAKKAGYSPSTTTGGIYKFLTRPEVQKIIKVNEALENQRKHEDAKLAREIKRERAFFDVINYFEKKQETRYTKDGEEYYVTVMALKDMENMTELQRQCIDGIESKGQSSTPVYAMPNREKALDDLIKQDNELLKSLDEAGEEETREIIIERITLRETKRAERPPELKYEIIEEPIEITDESDV